MTLFAYYLVRLSGDERWAEYGKDWWNSVEVLGELDELHDWPRHGAGDRQLDWGAWLRPISKQELLDSYNAKLSGLSTLTERERDQYARLKALPEADYAIAVVELPGGPLATGPGRR